MAVHTKNDNYISAHTNALLKVRTAVLLFITLNAHTINSDAFWLAVKVFIVQQLKKKIVQWHCYFMSGVSNSVPGGPQSCTV